jgi:signal-transduction protein with cAMP-binding, CBS, and nucleotidyltransferase domain
LAQIQPNSEIGRLLKHVPLLSKLSDSERATLGGAVVERHFESGEFVIRQGEVGAGFFIIRRGTVIVQRTDEEGNTQDLATLKAGGGETKETRGGERGRGGGRGRDGNK